MRTTRMRLVSVAIGLLLVTLALTAQVSVASAAGRPQIAVVLDPGGCSGENTLRLCEQIRNALSHSTVRGRVVAPTFRENLADTLALLARQGYEAVTIWGIHADPPVAAVARRCPARAPCQQRSAAGALPPAP